MAEIHIQKKRTPIWPWIIGVLIVVIIALILIDNPLKTKIEDTNIVVFNDTTESDYKRTDTSHASEKVNDFVLFINNPPEDKSSNEVFIKEGVKKLSGALTSIVDEKFPAEAEINNKADFVQQKSDSLITENNFSKNSKEIKEIFISTTEVLNSIQQKNNQNMDAEISEVKNSAEKINSGKPAIHQQKEIQTFFKEAGDILQVLAGSDDTDLNNRKRY